MPDGVGGRGERGRRGETEKLPSSSSDALYCNWIRSSTLPPSSLLLGHLEKSPPSIWCQVALISTFCESQLQLTGPFRKRQVQPRQRRPRQILSEPKAGKAVPFRSCLPGRKTCKEGRRRKARWERTGSHKEGAAGLQGKQARLQQASWVQTLTNPSHSASHSTLASQLQSFRWPVCKQGLQYLLPCLETVERSHVEGGLYC